MDATLNALGQLIVQALPTFFIVLLLHFYLKNMFFKPLGRILAERKEATEGARQKATEALERANSKAGAYEEQLRSARNVIYQSQEEQRRKWRGEQAEQVAAARRNAERLIASAKGDLAQQADQAKHSLEADSRALADQITRQILGRSAV